MVMANTEPTIAGYPKSFLSENTGTTSEKIPKAGKTTMYTSGCPNSQKRFTNCMGIPPCPNVKNDEPNSRSNRVSSKAIVKGGKAKIIKAPVTKTVQTNIGIRIKVMPGARIRNIVVMKLMPVMVVPIPAINSDTK